MRDFVVLPERPTEMASIREVVEVERQSSDNDSKRIVVLRHLNMETVADVFAEVGENGEKIKHRHVVIATRKDGAQRTWFCPTRDGARAYVKKVKAADGEAKFVTVKVG
jgi:hypothetical protein